MLLASAAVCFGTALAPPVISAEDVSKGAAEFVQNLADRVIRILKDKSLGKDARVKALAAVFLDGFDVRAIGLFVLGVYGRKVSDAERASYLEAFKDYVVQTYAARFNTYAGESFVVTKATPDGETGAWVFSDIGKTGEEPTEVQWRVRRVAGSAKIVDVVVEGVSLVVTQRSEFASVLQRNNGSVANLTQLLRGKIVELQKKS
jgi:phospholipid transport system substrate-binding protein